MSDSGAGWRGCRAAARGTKPKVLFVFLAIAGLGGCVSMEDAPMVKNSVAKDQKTVVIVYASPGPVMDESSSNLDQAAKVVPGLSFFLAATQNKRDLEASQKLQARLPPWQPADLFYSFLLKELAAGGFPGRFISPAEAGLSEGTLQDFNHADDVIDWQKRYCARSPDSVAPLVPRNYAAIPELNGVLVLEVNLAYGAPSDGKGNWTPNLSFVTKLYRAGDMKLLWRHEDSVSDKDATRASSEFESRPADLLAKLEGLMPALARALAGSFKVNIQEAGAAAPNP